MATTSKFCFIISLIFASTKVHLEFWRWQMSLQCKMFIPELSLLLSKSQQNLVQSCNLILYLHCKKNSKFCIGIFVVMFVFFFTHWLISPFRYRRIKSGWSICLAGFFLIQDARATLSKIAQINIMQNVVSFQ